MKQVKRCWEFIPIYFIAVMLLTGSTPALAATGASAAPDHITLTWASNPTTTQTITWRTDTTVSNGYVEYIQVGGSARARLANAHTATATVEILNADVGDMNIHSVTLTGLTPGTQYSYRVGDGTNWSKSYTFTTQQAGTPSFNFIVLTDIHCGYPNDTTGVPTNLPYTNNLHAAFSNDSDAKFVVMDGDTLDYAGLYDQWNLFYAGGAGVIDTIPVVPATGNHEPETKINGSKAYRKPVEFITQFKVPQNGPASQVVDNQQCDGLKGEVYSYNYGDVHFVILDSQATEEAVIGNDAVSRFPGGAQQFLDLQTKWLDNDLKSTTKKWKIVIFHKTPYYEKSNKSNEKVKSAFAPIFDKYHVDVVFNGHDHDYSRTYPMTYSLNNSGDGNNYFWSNPASGTVYITCGRSGDKADTPLSTPRVWAEKYDGCTDYPTFLTVSVNNSSVTINAYKTLGSSGTTGTTVSAPFDTYTIYKSGNTESDSPATTLPSVGSKAGPQLVVFGGVASYNGTKLTVQQNNGIWYIPLSFITDPNIGATSYKATSTQVTFTLKGQSYLPNLTSGTVNYTFTIGSTTVGGSGVTLNNPIISIGGVPMISAPDITKLWGLSYSTMTDSNNIVNYFALTSVYDS